MEIKTCEQYVLDQLEQARAERDWLRGKLEQAQDEAEELRGKLMERGERDASKVEQAIRKEGRRKLYRDGTGYRTSVDDGGKLIPFSDWCIEHGGGRMSAKTTELKPCPFCGSGNVRYKEAEHAVVCARCKARGSIAPDEEMAIRMWDERAGELKPDSWEKLEEDVNLGCRDYCEKHRLEECDYNMRVHMLDRAKKLAGIEDEAQR